MSKTNSQTMRNEAEAALLHEMWYADGRSAALRFAWECNGSIEQLRNKAQEVKAYIYNPPDTLKDRMTPGASTRIYQDGYLQGLLDAVSILEEPQDKAAPATAVAHTA